MKIVIVDDHQSFREALQIALGQEPEMVVAASVATGREALKAIEELKPDLAVIDFSLPDTDGASLVAELNRRKITVPTLILSMHRTAPIARGALNAGATGYATKDQPLREVIAAMHQVAAGTRYVAPALRALTASDVRNPAGPSDFLGGLSRRERQIFSMIIEGRSTAEIGRQLCISLKTVETHRAHINRKLDVHSSAELVRLAAVTGLLGLGEPSRRGNLKSAIKSPPSEQEDDPQDAPNPPRSS
jgi:DNA-binding NarL/FixJ family response regulator